jgi:hypothetical protein
MAIIKKVSYKGLEVEYWCITRKVTNWNKAGATRTNIELSGFVNQAARTANLSNSLKEVSFNLPGELTLEQAYEQIKLIEPKTRMPMIGEEIDFRDAVDLI